MPLFGEIVRFGLTGATATLIHLGVGLGLHYTLGLDAFTANIFAFGCAVLVSYLGNSRYVFPKSSSGSGAFARFSTVAVLGLCINQGIVFVGVGLWDRPYWQALAVLVSVVPAMMFVLVKFWALRR